jgi:hypothetical protein
VIYCENIRIVVVTAMPTASAAAAAAAAAAVRQQCHLGPPVSYARVQHWVDGIELSKARFQQSDRGRVALSNGFRTLRR